MPAVALLSRPNGEPIARTHSPGRSCDGSPDAHGRQILRLDLDHCHVAARIEADDLRREFAPVGQPHGDFVGLGDDVRVRQDVTVAAHDEAGACAACRHAFARDRRPAAAASRSAGRNRATDRPPSAHPARASGARCWTTSTFTTALPYCSTSGGEIRERRGAAGSARRHQSAFACDGAFACARLVGPRPSEQAVSSGAQCCKEDRE